MPSCDIWLYPGHHLSLSLSEHGIVPVSSDCQYLFPAKVVSRLVKWVMIPHEDYMVGGQMTGLPYCLGVCRPCHLSVSIPLLEGQEAD